MLSENRTKIRFEARKDLTRCQIVVYVQKNGEKIFCSKAASQVRAFKQVCRTHAKVYDKQNRGRAGFDGKPRDEAQVVGEVVKSKSPTKKTNDVEMAKRRKQLFGDAAIVKPAVKIKLERSESEWEELLAKARSNSKNLL